MLRLEARGALCALALGLASTTLGCCMHAHGHIVVTGEVQSADGAPCKLQLLKGRHRTKDTRSVKGSFREGFLTLGCGRKKVRFRVQCGAESFTSDDYVRTGGMSEPSIDLGVISIGAEERRTLILDVSANGTARDRPFSAAGRAARALRTQGA